MKAIILDGYFQGLVVEWNGDPTMVLQKPMSRTYCSCDPENETEHDYARREVEYKLAARGYDGTCLFSLNGDLFDPMTKSRTWITDKRKSPFAQEGPVFFTCREWGAFQ